MCVNFNLFCIFLIEKQRGPARHPQAASAGRRAVATHLLNKGVTKLDGISDLVTEKGQLLTPITNKTTMISYSFAYRPLNTDARCVLIAALPKSARAQAGTFGAIKVSARSSN